MAYDTGLPSSEAFARMTTDEYNALADDLYQRSLQEAQARDEPDPLLPLENPLNEQDRQSATWQKIKDYLENRLVDARRLNDHPHTELETAHLRGKIAAIKEILDMEEELSYRVREDHTSPDGDKGPDPDDLGY